MCSWCQLFCALCRITCYKCCHKSLVARPEYSIITVGLTSSGKSKLLAVLGNEDIDNIEPTQGFSIKAVQFPGAILNVKELGGSVEKYWSHYFAGAQGIVFVVDSCNANKLDEASDCLVKVLSNPALMGLPLLVLANKQDLPGAIEPEKISKLLKLEEIITNQSWTIYGCSVEDKDSITSGFQFLIDKLLVESMPEENRL